MGIDKKNLKFYSQHGEDSLLWEFFDFKEKGFFVEVGAFDGKYLSNTYSFEEQGWTGLCVEPNPQFFKACRKNRPGSVNANFACVGDDDTEEVVLKVEPAGLYSGLADDPERSEYVKKIFENNEQTFDRFVDISVPASTLNSLLEKYFPDVEKIDFVSIDVEGTEIDVLRGFDLERYSPEVLIIEANSEESGQEVTDYLVSHGYNYARMTGVNLVFVNSRESLQRMQNLIIRCRIEKQEHPLDSAYSVKGIAEGLHVDDFAMLQEKVGKLERKLMKVKKRAAGLEGKYEQLEGKYERLDNRYRKLLISYADLLRDPLIFYWARFRGYLKRPGNAMKKNLKD